MADRESRHYNTRRSWRTLHIGVDAGTGQIVAAVLTRKESDDGSQVSPLLDQVAASVASFTAEGAYDQDSVTASVAARHPEAAIIVPPRSTTVPSASAETEPTQRDVISGSSPSAAERPGRKHPDTPPGRDDRNDAEAISEAAARPGLPSVAVRSAEQQAEAIVLSARELLVRQRTKLVNAVRGHAAEFGIVAAKTISQLPALLVSQSL